MIELNLRRVNQCLLLNAWYSQKIHILLIQCKCWVQTDKWLDNIVPILLACYRKWDNSKHLKRREDQYYMKGINY